MSRPHYCFSSPFAQIPVAYNLLPAISVTLFKFLNKGSAVFGIERFQLCCFRGMEGRDMLNELLCEELLGEILGKLQDISCYRNACLVCKRWLIVQRRVKTELGLCFPKQILESSSFGFWARLFLAQFPQIFKLSLGSAEFQNDTAVSDGLLEALGDYCRLLRELRFGVGAISCHGLQALAVGCSNLSKLELSGLNPECIPALSSLKSLKELTLVLSGRQSKDRFCEQADWTLSIENLRLIGIGTGCRSLDWLWRNCPRLRNLEFHHCEGLGIWDMSSFVKVLSGIEELKLRRCRIIATAVLLRVAEYSKKLKFLMFYDGGDAEGLHDVVRGCKDLKHLDLRLPLDLGNDDLAVIAQNGKSLRSLSLHSCWLATGEGIKSLVPGLRFLEELVLVRCRAAVQEPGTLTTLCQQLRCLKTLDLSDNDSLLDKELMAMLPSCENLSSLRLWRCRRLTDISMLSIMQRCWMLENIDIERCEGVSTDGVLALIIGCPKLRQLTVEEFKVTEESRKMASRKKISILTSEKAGFKQDRCGYELSPNDLA